MTLLDEEEDNHDEGGSRERIQQMVETLEKKHGFQCFMTTLGGEGCLWHNE